MRIAPTSIAYSANRQPVRFGECDCESCRVDVKKPTSNPTENPSSEKAKPSFLARLKDWFWNVWNNFVCTILAIFNPKALKKRVTQLVKEGKLELDPHQKLLSKDEVNRLKRIA